MIEPPKRLQALLTCALDEEDAERAAKVTRIWLLDWFHYFLDTCRDREGNIVEARAWIADGLALLSAEILNERDETGS